MSLEQGVDLLVALRLLLGLLKADPLLLELAIEANEPVEVEKVCAA